jgi:hypothetical protein
MFAVAGSVRRGRENYIGRWLNKKNACDLQASQSVKFWIF